MLIRPDTGPDRRQFDTAGGVDDLDPAILADDQPIAQRNDLRNGQIGIDRIDNRADRIARLLMQETERVCRAR